VADSALPDGSVVPQRITGRLRLEIEPDDGAQLFVDTEFVGTLGEVGREVELEAGSRHLEIRAPDFETIAIDARIEAFRTITYRGTLTPLAGKAEIAAPPAVRQPPAASTKRSQETFYVIPGCYMGNLPPSTIKLPAGCDASRVITSKP
jgi:hypothetical protein